MGHGEDNLWSLIKDLAPLLFMFALIGLVFFVVLRSSEPDLKRWKQNRYFRWFGTVYLFFSLGLAVLQAVHNWKVFYGLR